MFKITTWRNIPLPNSQGRKDLMRRTFRIIVVTSGLLLFALYFWNARKIKLASDKFFFVQLCETCDALNREKILFFYVKTSADSCIFCEKPFYSDSIFLFISELVRWLPWWQFLLLYFYSFRQESLQVGCKRLKNHTFQVRYYFSLI